MLNEEVKIINKLGLHTRAAAKLVALAARFESRIELKRLDNQQTANCKSIMAILLLGVSSGTTLEIAVKGADELDARDAIINLIKNRFGEPE